MGNGMKKSAIGATFAVALMAGSLAATSQAEDRKSIPAPAGHPLTEIYSGFEFRTPETQALQMDDFDNPGFLWVERGAEMWDTAEGTEGKACADCHGEASESMATAGAEFPKWNANLNKPVNLEQQINMCRTERMGAEELKWKSDDLLGMTAFVRLQSRGVPVHVALDEGNMQEWSDKGKELYYERVGQLDLSCANCHEDNYGNYIRSDLLSQGQSNGFPTYRLKWQGMGSLHRRFKGCMDQVRADPYKFGSDEFVALEVYLAYRGVGLPVEAPAVRN